MILWSNVILISGAKLDARLQWVITQASQNGIIFHIMMIVFFLPEALIKYGLVELNLNRTKKQDLALPHIKHRAL
mgnify:CR=1 FL=1